MASSLVGSTNQADAFTADMEGQMFKVNGDATSQASGMTLISADGSEFKLSVSDAGALTAEAV